MGIGQRRARRLYPDANCGIIRRHLERLGKERRARSPEIERARLACFNPTFIEWDTLACGDAFLRVDANIRAGRGLVARVLVRCAAQRNLAFGFCVYLEISHAEFHLCFGNYMDVFALYLLNGKMRVYPFRK